MSYTRNHAVMRWLFIFASIVAFLVVFGGFVRLTRSGLSIVEWNPVSGAIPPLSQGAWEQEFAKYQQTPEYININSGMTLEEYKFIFYMEWFHRFIARFAGLVYAIPVFYFLFKKIIPWREFGVYFLMGMLFISQAVVGWLMVASGLVDRPSVSHFGLTAHLLLALTLLGIAYWMALGHQYGFHGRKARWSVTYTLAIVSFIALVIQIAYGGMTAGLKAGHVSDTWPWMFGRLIPPDLLNSWIDLLENPLTIVFIHRWFAWMCMLLLLAVFHVARKNDFPMDLQKGLTWLLIVVSLQIVLGILTVLSYVHILIALAHQANAMILFVLMIFFIHRLRALTETPGPTS
jgi:cytochrome c oxidase assembly protein subunit 15